MQQIQQQDQSISQGEVGIYTLTSSDLKAIDEIESMGRTYMMSIDEMGCEEAISQLSSLFSQMSIFMEKYGFSEYMRAAQFTGYTFDYVKNSIAMTEGEPDLLRRSCEIAFSCWESVFKRLGVGLPTSSFRSKKEYYS